MHARLLVPAFVFAACGTPAAPELENDTARSAPIIEGEECGADEYPTAVALLVDATIRLGSSTFPIKTVSCTGTLIAPDVVLTAAHCLDSSALTMGFGDVEEESYFVTTDPALTSLAQGQSTDFPEDSIGAASWVVHEDFDLNAFNEVDGPGTFYDVALIFLANPIEGVRPEALIRADEASQLEVGKSVEIVGWGQQTETSMFEQPPAGTVGEKICATSVINELGETEMQIGTTGSRKCHGDSGGPTYMEVDSQFDNARRVIGTTSHAYDAEDCAKGGVDTRVDAYLDWIDDAMRTACNDGTRSWCDVEGIIAPDYFEGGYGSNDGETSGTSNKKGGCAQLDVSAVAALLGLALVARLRFVR